MGEAEEGRVGDPVYLTVQGPVELGTPMPPDVHPEGGITVQEPPSVDIAEPDPLP